MSTELASQQTAGNGVQQSLISVPASGRGAHNVQPVHVSQTNISMTQSGVGQSMLIGQNIHNTLRNSYVRNESIISNSPLPNANVNQTLTKANLIYKPEGLKKAQEVKQSIDDVLDNLKGMVTHVTQREEMKIRQHTNPQLNHAKNKIQTEELRVKTMLETETKEHLELKSLLNEIKQYHMMTGQLRGKISNVDFNKHRERIFLDKLHLINQSKKEDLNVLNRDNMMLSYEIDELLDRIKLKKDAKIKSENNDGSPKSLSQSLKKDFSRNSLKKKLVTQGSQQSLSQTGGPAPYQILDLQKLQDLPQLQQEDLMYYMQQIERMEKDFKRLKTEHLRSGAVDNERQRKAKEAEELFKEGIKSCEKDIMKAHETGAVKDEHGSSYEKVSSSYFFEIKRKKFLQENPTTQLLDNAQATGPAAQSTSLINNQALDRHSKDVIYKTIKHILFNAKEDKKRAHIMSVQIEWDEFRRFTPMQIMGLLLLRDDALDKMEEVLFAKNRGKMLAAGASNMHASGLPPVSPMVKK